MKQNLLGIGVLVLAFAPIISAAIVFYIEYRKFKSKSS